MSLRAFDFECLSCHHIQEDLIRWNSQTDSQDEPNPTCPNCTDLQGNPSPTQRLFHTVGSAIAAQTDPVKQREIMDHTRHMQLRLQGRLPWRKSSYSQTRNH